LQSKFCLRSLLPSRTFPVSVLAAVTVTPGSGVFPLRAEHCFHTLELRRELSDAGHACRWTKRIATATSSKANLDCKASRAGDMSYASSSWDSRFHTGSGAESGESITKVDRRTDPGFTPTRTVKQQQWSIAAAAWFQSLAMDSALSSLSGASSGSAEQAAGAKATAIFQASHERSRREGRRRR